MGSFAVENYTIMISSLRFQTNLGRPNNMSLGERYGFFLPCVAEHKFQITIQVCDGRSDRWIAGEQCCSNQCKNVIAVDERLNILII